MEASPETPAQPAAVTTAGRPRLSVQLEMLMRLARELAASEGVERASIEHLRKLLFSQRVAVMLDLARAIDEAKPGERARLKAELAKAEESFRLSLGPPL